MLLRRLFSACAKNYKASSPYDDRRLNSILDNEAILAGCLEQHLLFRTMEPYFNLSYPAQLQRKQEDAELCMMKLANIAKSNRGLPTTEMKIAIKNNNGLACVVDPIKASPVVDSYRNKDSYSIGTHINGTARAVGFYASSEVVKGLRIVSGKLKSHRTAHYEISKIYQEFLRRSSLDVCSLNMDNGHWRNVGIRSNEAGQLMVSVAFHPQQLNQDAIERAKAEVFEYFMHGPGRQVKIDSLYFHSCTRVLLSSEGGPYSLLHGQPYLIETLLGLKFRLSPDAFWQLNTQAASVLYDTVRQCAGLTDNTVLLDICCGAGSIGISLAKHAKKVIGIERIKQAIDDAEFNASQNGLENTDYICGLAEKSINLLGNFDEQTEVVAVVNPGRGGLALKVMKAMRRIESLRKIIYISCKPTGRACFNFVELCQTESARFHGKAFHPVRAVPVDMFPHTPHYDLVVVLER